MGVLAQISWTEVVRLVKPLIDSWCKGEIRRSQFADACGVISKTRGVPDAGAAECGLRFRILYIQSSFLRSHAFCGDHGVGLTRRAGPGAEQWHVVGK